MRLYIITGALTIHDPTFMRLRIITDALTIHDPAFMRLRIITDALTIHDLIFKRLYIMTKNFSVLAGAVIYITNSLCTQTINFKKSRLGKFAKPDLRLILLFYNRTIWQGLIDGCKRKITTFIFSR